MLSSGGGGSSSGAVGLNEPLIDRRDIYNSYFLTTPLRLTNVSIVNPYPQLHLPQIPVVHPYNPIERATEVPVFSVTMKLSVPREEYLPPGLVNMLSKYSIPLKNLDVFVCMQTRPWDRSLILRPHPWLHPQAPATGNAHFGSTIGVGVFDLDGAVDHLGSSGSLTTHPSSEGIVFSSTQLSFAKNAVGDTKKTHCFYSVCADSEKKKAALTVHSLMNDNDFESVQWALNKSENMHEFIGGMREFKNSALNGTLGNEDVAWTFLDTLKSLALQEQPFCQFLTRDCRYRLTEQGGLNQVEYQRLKQQSDAAQDNAQQKATLERVRRNLGEMDRLANQLQQCYQACQSEKKRAQFIAMQHSIFLGQLQSLSLIPIAASQSLPQLDDKLIEVDGYLTGAEQLKKMATPLLDSTTRVLDALANIDGRLPEMSSNLFALHGELQRLLDQFCAVNSKNRDVNQQLIQQVSSAKSTPPSAPSSVSVSSSNSSATTTGSGQSVEQIFAERLASLQEKREASMRLLDQPGLSEAIPDHQRITLDRLCQTAESRFNSWGKPGKFDSLPQARADQLRGKGISAFEGLIQQLDEQSATIRQALARHQGHHASSTDSGAMLHQRSSSGNTTNNTNSASTTVTPASRDRP